MTTTTSELRVGNRLTEGMNLASPSGDHVLTLSSGTVALHAASAGVTRTAPSRRPVATVLMRSDGNLVATGVDRRQAWSSGTAGHPGAVASVSDLGSLVVHAADGAELWSSGAQFDWRTVKTTDDRGYHYDETSNSWKQACEQLPCFAGLAWPGYKSTVVETTIDGTPVVIQLWKGRCQRFFGVEDFPGGAGAEVGVYRRQQGRPLPTSLDLGSRLVNAAALARLKLFNPGDYWWADPDVHPVLTFELVNPITGDVIFAAGPETTYWLNRWMYPEDYARYAASVGVTNMPLSASHCLLRYTVNGGPVTYWPGDEAQLGAYDPLRAEL